MLIQRPTNRRAGCEKIARPVRREGQGQIPCSYPYPILNLEACDRRIVEHSPSLPGRRSDRKLEILLCEERPCTDAAGAPESLLLS